MRIISDTMPSEVNCISLSHATRALTISGIDNSLRIGYRVIKQSHICTLCTPIEQDWWLPRLFSHLQPLATPGLSVDSLDSVENLPLNMGSQ
jgi:hypothetical protein